MKTNKIANYCTAILFLLVIVSGIVFPQQPRKQMHMNFQKAVLYHSKSTSEYYLTVLATDDKTRQCRLDLLNTHIILEMKNGEKKNIDNEDLKISCLGNMYNKVIGQKHTLFRFNLIIDNSSSIDTQSLSYVQDALKKFLEAVPLVFEAQVIKFSHGVQAKTDFTKDVTELINVINHPHPQGSTALFDSMDLGIQELVAKGDDVPLRFSVVFTDGRNNASPNNPDPIAFKSKIVEKCKKNLIPLFIVGVTKGVDGPLMNEMAQFGMYQHKDNFPEIDQAFKVILEYIKDTYVFKIPAIGNFSNLKTIYIVRKTAAGNYDTIQDIIVQ